MRSQMRKLFAIGLAAVFLAVGALLVSPQASYAASWEQAGTSGLGGGVTSETVVRLVNFNNTLFASIGNAVSGVGIFKSSDGSTWTQANTSGFGVASNVDAVMIIHDSALYAGTVTLGGQAQIWKTTDGTSWTQIGTDGFGDANNSAVIGLGELNGKLYIGASNGTTGAEVFRLDNTTLTQVNLDGFDGNSLSVWTLKEYNGSFYAGTQSTGGAQIWKTTDGTTWSKVMDGGFGDANNVRINTLFTFNDKMYAGTLNPATGTELWRTTTGDSAWEQINSDGFGDALTDWTGDQVAVINGTIYLGTRNFTNGARLFTSTNGSTWVQEGTNGFGDPANNFAMYAITFNGRIYLGISSATGAEIWRTGTMDTLSITTTSLGDETVGSPYSAQLSTNAGTAPITFSLTSGSLPDGQTINSTGTISGTPTKSGTYTFTISVVDSGDPQQLASRELTIKVVDAPVTLPETGGNHLLDWADNLI